MCGNDGLREAEGAKEPYASGVKDAADVGGGVFMSNASGGSVELGWGLLLPPLLKRFSNERFIWSFFDRVGLGGPPPPPSWDDLLIPPNSVGGIGGVCAGGGCCASQSRKNDATWSWPKLVARYSGFVPCLSALDGSAPCESKMWTMLRCPLAAAKWSGVDPEGVWIIRSRAGVGRH